jgi:type I restriction enzyme, S subunit
MIGDLKPYPSYRPAEGGWLGEIPSHWMVRRMKYIVRETDSRSTTGKEQLLRVSQYTGVTERRLANDLDGPDTRAESLIGYKRVESSDLVINIMLAWNGSMGVSAYTGIVSPAYCVYRFDQQLQPWYFNNLLRSPGYKARIKASSTGVVESRLRLYSDDLGRIEALLPPPDEQAAIVRFLHWASGRLERAIQAKRKVIALLNEQKRAIIHRAVTRGLDPSVPLKPSGIPWLGDIPQHWEVRSFVRCTIERGDYRGATPEKVESGVFLVTAKNVRKGWIDYETSKEFVRASEYSKIMRRGLPKKGDILLTMEAPLGHIALIDREDIALAQRIIRFRLDPMHLLPEFALLCLNSAYFQNQLYERATGSTAQGLKASKLPQLLVALPAVTEQGRIVERVRHECTPAESAISRLEREIELLREYRIRLVADVVTGKLDVREAAARLPDEPQNDVDNDDMDAIDNLNVAEEDEA